MGNVQRVRTSALPSVGMEAVRRPRERPANPVPWTAGPAPQGARPAPLRAAMDAHANPASAPRSPSAALTAGPQTASLCVSHVDRPVTGVSLGRSPVAPDAAVKHASVMRIRIAARMPGLPGAPLYAATAEESARIRAAMARATWRLARTVRRVLWIAAPAPTGAHRQRGRAAPAAPVKRPSAPRARPAVSSRGAPSASPCARAQDRPAMGAGSPRRLAAPGAAVKRVPARRIRRAVRSPGMPSA